MAKKKRKPDQKHKNHQTHSARQDAQRAYDASGYVGILNTDGEMLAMIEAGFQPDMVTFTPDGSKILVANEGEPRNGYGEDVVDPAGSVTIIWLNSEDPASSSHKNIGFEAFDEKREELVANGVILSKDNLPSVDLEPEYIACDNNTAYISLMDYYELDRDCRIITAILLWKVNLSKEPRFLFF